MTAACGGGGGPGPAVAPAPPTTPTPPPVPTPPPPPAPPNYDTAEYQQSTAAVAINALAAYNAGAEGAGIKVGLIDSGLGPDAPAILGGRIDPSSRDVVVGRSPGEAVDFHGTSVAAVIAAERDNVWIHGVAPESTIASYRTDTPGSCATDCKFGDAAIGAGINAARVAGAKVINISLGGDGVGPAVTQAIDSATGAGIIVVIAAGNDMAANPDAFALISESQYAHGRVIVAGAVDSSGTLATFSNKAGVAAAHYLATIGVGVNTYKGDGTLISADGTSYSAPGVSGAVALLESAFPNLSADAVISLLYTTARKAGAGVDPTYGQGQLDLTRAFQPVGATAVAGSVHVIGPAVSADPMLVAPNAVAAALSKVIVLDSYGRAYRAAPRPIVAGARSGIAGLAWGSGGGQAGPLAVTWSPVPGVRLTSPASPGWDGIGASLQAGPVGPFATQPPVNLGYRFTSGAGPFLTEMAVGSAVAGFISTPMSAASPSGLVDPSSGLDPAQPATGDLARTGLRFAFGPYSTTIVTSPVGSVLAFDRATRFGAATLSFGGRVSVRQSNQDNLLARQSATLLGLTGERSGGAVAAVTLPLSARWLFAVTGEADAVAPTVAGGGLIRAAAPFARTSWAASLFQTEHGLRLGATVAQPPRNTGGRYTLLVPTGYDYSTVTPSYSSVALAASTRALLREELSLTGGSGALSVAGALFHGPAGVSSDVAETGVAARLGLRF